MSASKQPEISWALKAVRFQGGLFMFMFMSVSVTKKHTCKGGPFLGGLRVIHHICHMV